MPAALSYARQERFFRLHIEILHQLFYNVHSVFLVILPTGGIFMELTLSDFERAAERLRPILHHTELDLSSTFSKATGGQIYLKCENRQ